MEYVKPFEKFITEREEHIPKDFYNEAIGLIDFLGGYVPQDRDWREQCKPYFVNRDIAREHWDTIYWEALSLVSQP